MEQVDTELHDAVRYSDLELVKDALGDKHDPNSIGLYQWSPMHEAASNGDYDILELLLKSGGKIYCQLFWVTHFLGHVTQKQTWNVLVSHRKLQLEK